MRSRSVLCLADIRPEIFQAVSQKMIDDQQELQTEDVVGAFE